MEIPKKFAREYYREVKRLLEIDRRHIWQAFQTEIRPRILEYRAVLTTNSRIRVNDSLDEIARILFRLRELSERLFSNTVVDRIARVFVEQINDYQKRQFRNRTMKILGFDPTHSEPWLASFVETAVQENVKWVKTIQSEYFDDISTIVLQGARRGENLNDVARAIAEAAGTSLSRARFIARDQEGSLYGDMTRARQQRAGLERFRWSTSGDSRVRDSHAALDGEIFTWAEGAKNERGEAIWPGTDYNCRCVAEVVEEDLMEVADEHDS